VVRLTHLYRIVCRKRSNLTDFASTGNVYWMPNRSGYTNDITMAGLYTALELDECAGNGFDWFAERIK